MGEAVIEILLYSSREGTPMARGTFTLNGAQRMVWSGPCETAQIAVDSVLLHAEKARESEQEGKV